MEARQEVIAPWRWVLLALIIAVLILLNRDLIMPASQLLLHGVAGYLFYCPSTMLHEVGHALAGIVAGVAISQIEVGSGRELLRFKVSGAQIIFKTGFGGRVFPGSYPGNYTRLSDFIFVLGGPLMDLAVALFLYYSMDSGWSNSLESSGIYIPHVLLIFQTRKLYHSLWPRQVLVVGDYVDNDMASLLKIPYMNEIEIMDLRARYFLRKADEAMNNGQLGKAEDICRQGLLSVPASAVLKLELANSIIMQGQHSQAFPLLEEALKANNSPYLT